MTPTGGDLPPGANELSATRVLYRGAIFAIAMVALALLLLQLRFVIIQVFAALIIAAGMAPLVDRATDPRRTHILGWRPPKAAVVVLIYIVLGAVLVVLGSIMIGSAVEALNSLLARAPDYATQIDAWIADLQARFPFLADLHVIDLFGGASGLSQSISSALTRLVGAASILLTIFGGAVNVLFVLFMALYMTVDGGKILDYTIVFFPLSRQPQARRVMTNIAVRLSHWLVGQLLLALVIGSVAGIGLGLLGANADEGPGYGALEGTWQVTLTTQSSLVCPWTLCNSRR